MKRIFIAVDISERAREKAGEYIDELRRAFQNVRVGWEQREKLHLTLKFIGDTTEVQLEALKEAVQKTAMQTSRFTLEIGKTGVFPRGRKARVLWLGAKDPSGELGRLSARLEIECEETGFEREKRDFRPHLTIARLRQPQLSTELVDRHLRMNFEPVRFEVPEIAIYESRLKAQGSSYSIVAAYPLTG